MKATIIAAGLAAAAQAQIDWKAFDAAPKAEHVRVPIGGGEQIVVYDKVAAAAAAVTQVLNKLKLTLPPILGNLPIPIFGGLATVKRQSCRAQPQGAGTVPSPDTADAFLAYAGFASAAAAAPVPPGYHQTFSSLAASTSAYGYLGYTTLQTYDTGLCASKCNSVAGCSAFNIYFERDPSVEPGPSCPNPPSTTNIKCVFWGGPIGPDNTKNDGQWRRDFHVVMAGSNGYVSDSIAPQSGYGGPGYLGEAAIQAPVDCSGAATDVPAAIFTSGPFDAGLCAAACSAHTAYSLSHPPADGSKPKTCQFFNTFMLLKNGIPEGQHCSMYTMAWDPKYATNTGQWRGSDRYTIFYSYTFVNSTDPGKPAGPCTTAVESS